MTGAFLNLTIVRLFMINPDCSGSSSEDKSCETMKMNCDGNFSTSYRSDEESCKENIYEVNCNFFIESVSFKMNQL